MILYLRRNMKLLDLFCGAGGAAKGYELAGFDKIIGIDNVQQDHYPYKFIKYDALDYLQEEDLRSYDLIHASPPCQGYSWSAMQWDKGEYPRLIEPLRKILIDKMCDYVIENVKGSPLISPTMGSKIYLEGNMFDLPIVRRRLFECSFYCQQLKIKPHGPPLCTISGHGCSAISSSLDSWCFSMDIWWMDKSELRQAIPPKYTQYVGKQFLEQYENA